MRVLSFIPAFLLAAASFVAAAPAASPRDAVPSCVPSAGGNDAALQPIISIIVNATSQIQPLSDKLTSCQGSGTPDVDTVSDIVVQITEIISNTVDDLKAAVKVDLSGLDLTNLCSTIYALLILVFTILGTLVKIVLALAGSAVGTLQTVICNLLHAVTNLVGCLKIFVNAALTGVLGPVIDLVCGVVDLLLGIVGGLNVLVGVAH
ncbi:hypothetical protein J3R83DRAFT_5368 [Lanmaoa asiatica]|nr:hypothetical protein J3R83DRAFT_5368 [Lanmaoa asiatica]